MTKRYLVVDSTYRNRNLFPHPSQFEIELSTSGTKNKLTAVDPVCDSMPVNSWVSNEMIVGTIPSALITGTITAAPLTGSMNDTLTFYIDGGGSALQQIDHYYTNLILEVTGGAGVGVVVGERRRIISYKYIGDNQAIITLDVRLTGNPPITFEINDPTDVTTSTSAPVIFVPNGLDGENSYSGLILFNETMNEHRPIIYYNHTTGTIQIDTTNNLIVGWSEDDKFSIRKSPPIVVGDISVVTSSKIFDITLPVSYGKLSTSNDFYNGDFVRISNVDTNEDQTSRILDYSYNSATSTGTFTLETALTLVVTDRVEILQFSRDNYNPMVHVGSDGAQMQEVCYKIEMIDLTLPNQILKAKYGSRIAFYPYVWVELRDVYNANSNKNVLISNNPNTPNYLFRVPIDDISNPLSSAFLKNDADGAVQTIKFKPNSNLKFGVYLPDGQIFETEISDNLSPAEPNGIIQIAATFSFERV